MLEQSQRSPPTRTLEPRLQGIHLAHAEGDTPWDGHPLLGLAQRAIAGLEYRPRLVPASGRQGFDRCRDRAIQQQRKQESRGDRLVLGDAQVRIAQALHQQLLDEASRMLFQVTVDRRKQRREQSAPPQDLEAGGPVAREKEL